MRNIILLCTTLIQGQYNVEFPTTTGFADESSGVLHYLAFIKGQRSKILKNEHSEGKFVVPTLFI